MYRETARRELILRVILTSVRGLVGRSLLLRVRSSNQLTVQIDEDLIVEDKPRECLRVLFISFAFC